MRGGGGDGDFFFINRGLGWLYVFCLRWRGWNNKLTSDLSSSNNRMIGSSLIANVISSADPRCAFTFGTLLHALLLAPLSSNSRTTPS